MRTVMLLVLLTVCSAIGAEAQTVDVDLLVRRTNNPGFDGPDSTRVYRLGDIITWRVLPYEWGVGEDPDKFAAATGLDPSDCGFFLVTVTAVPITEQTLRLRDWLRSEVVIDSTGGQPRTTIQKLRKFRLEPNDIPPGARNTLARTGKLSVTWDNLVSFIRDRL